MSTAALARRLAAIAPESPRGVRLARLADRLDRVRARPCQRCGTPMLDRGPKARFCKLCVPLVASEAASRARRGAR